jgi:DNA-nicking Smr family endonuclease
MPAPRRKKLTDTDRTIWAAFAGQIAPLSSRMPPQPPAAPAGMQAEPPEPPRRPTPSARSPGAASEALSVGDQPGGVDKASWKRLHSGKLAPQRTLDLHGRTAERSFHALLAFLHAAQADRLRCVEVITGRGSGEGGGILRRELPLWLNLPALRPLVLAASHPHAANPGAVRLLLRRPK